MKVYLDLYRFNKNWKLLEKRRQLSRSLTIGLMDYFYSQFNQILLAAPHTITNVDRVLFDIDTTNTAPYAQYIPGRIAAPGGNSAIQTGENGLATPAMYYSLKTSILGADLGILVGTGSTAVTPTDRRLVSRISHGVRPADGAETLFNSYAAGEDASGDISAATIWLGQMFVPAVSHRCTSVSVKLYKAAAPGDVTVRIRSLATHTAASAFYPTAAYCADLGSATIAEAAIGGVSPGALVKATFATPFDLYAGHYYAIIVNCPGAGGANHIYWRRDDAAPTFDRGFTDSSLASTKLGSADSGATWTSSGGTYMFEENGQSVGEFEISGCDILGKAIANPNGEFVIRRFFSNNSGGSIDVAESGLTCCGFHHDNSNQQYGAGTTYLIGRDVIGPAITVANTEILLATYTIQITV